MTPWRFAALWAALVLVALATGIDLLMYLAYLVGFAAVFMWVNARLSLDGLSVRRTVGEVYAHLGDTIDLEYELRNDHRLGKLWLEVFERSDWPEPLPGRVLSIGGRKLRRWKAPVRAVRRGRYTLGPIVLRSGDPFGLFSMVREEPARQLVLVYPRIVDLTRWVLPGSYQEGNVLTGQRSLQSTSMVMGVREYRPGDAVNRVHWPSSVRHRGLMVKEFELDRTADLWIFLDLDRTWHGGEGEQSSEERAVTVAASVAAKAIAMQRSVGLVLTGPRPRVFAPDRGAAQHGRLMLLLAEVRTEATQSLAETLVQTLPRLRRGSSCVIITPSLDRAWVRPAASLREAAIGVQTVLVSPPAPRDAHDAARRDAVLGELAVAGIPCGTLAPDAAIAELFGGRPAARPRVA